MTEAKKSLKRTLIGKVVSDKRQKTAHRPPVNASCSAALHGQRLSV